MKELLTLDEIKALFDGDYTANQTTRVSAADDRLFANVTQWDSSLLSDTQLSYRGEFDILRKARRDILADMDANPVQVSFEPINEREGSKDLLEGLYLEDEHHNATIEAYSNSTMEAVDCGLGGWELYTEWESNLDGTRNQVIRRRPLYEFNNKCFPDCNAKLLDKSDATRWTILVGYSKTGYQELYRKLTGETTEALQSNFSTPEISYVFPWFSDNETYYVARFYHKTEVPDRILFLTDPMGMPLTVRESLLQERGEDQDINLLDRLLEQGYAIVDEKPTTTFRVMLYICSGEAIMATYRIPGQYIPVVPNYGERTFVEDQEVWEGIVKRAKDPQRLRNFCLSSLGDLLARSPRQKPIFFPAQIAGYENMYQLNGADNNFAFVYQRSHDPSGNKLPEGPVGYLEAPQIPPAMTALVEATREAVEDVANPGLPNDIDDLDLSGKALQLVQGRFDKQSSVYQKHLKHAKRYDGLVYASMASEVYDVPRTVTVRKPDGSQAKMQIMQQVIDPETGEMMTINDITNADFRVYAAIGPSYQSKREKTIDKYEMLAEKMQASDPMLAKILYLQTLLLTDAPNSEALREYARKQLILMGVNEPETEEDVALLEGQQQEQPDAETITAIANDKLGQAAIMKEQRLALKDQADIEIDMGELGVKKYQAETERAKVVVAASEAGASNRLKLAQTRATKVDNVLKFRGSVTPARPALSR